MAAPHHESKPVARQRLADGAGRQGRRRRREAEVDKTLLHPGDDVASDRLEAEIETRRLGSEAGDQPRRKQDGLRVRRGDTDRALQGRGVEVPGAEEAPEPIERDDRLRDQRLGERRRRKGAPGPDEQRIVENLPQTCERPAHRRLAQAHLGRRARDVPASQQSLERRQQVEVEGG